MYIYLFIVLDNCLKDHSAGCSYTFNNRDAEIPLGFFFRNVERGLARSLSCARDLLKRPWLIEIDMVAYNEPDRVWLEYCNVLEGTNLLYKKKIAWRVCVCESIALIIFELIEDASAKNK